MNIFEFIIIYLACGAPFGVYFYFQQRENSRLWQNSTFVWFKCVIITLFWIPFAFKLFNKLIKKRLRKNEFAVNNFSDSNLKEKIEHIEKDFLQILLNTKSEISPFEFRTTFNRYVGLTLNNLPEQTNQNLGEFELYKIASHDNPTLGTICLQRRNRFHLKHHQINARHEIVRLLESIKNESVDQSQIYSLASELAKVINDVELTEKIDFVFDNSSQKSNTFSVQKWETEIWKTQTQKPIPTNQTALNLPQIRSSVMMSKRD